LKLKKWKIISSIVGIFTTIFLAFIAILTKTHLALGGNYLSTKNIKITIGIIAVISILLVGALTADMFDKSQDNDKSNSNHL
jgi:uncharacterized membrane protein